MTQFDEILSTDKGLLSNSDKALIAAIALLSTQHNPERPDLSFSHLTLSECFDKLVEQFEKGFL